MAFEVFDTHQINYFNLKKNHIRINLIMKTKNGIFSLKVKGTNVPFEPYKMELVHHM
jgi:hypothetical protein